MEITIRFKREAIEEQEHATSTGAGASLEFRGIVRDSEQEARIGGLIYEIYEPMADRIVRRIVEELDAQYPCLALFVAHRHGLVPVGQTAIYVRIEARHRFEAIRVLELFMNRLKAEVPIWKAGIVPC
ncbi:MAG TPA: molybdenum cofactor biosynthesis protein MoaE [Terrimicrobiaceae bacterium]